MEVRDWNQEREVIRASLLCCSIEADLVSTDLRGLTSHFMHPSVGHVYLAPPVIRLSLPRKLPSAPHRLEWAASLFSSLLFLPFLSQTLTLSTQYNTIQYIVSVDPFVSFLPNERLLAGPVKACHSLSEVSKSRNSRVTIPQPRSVNLSVPSSVLRQPSSPDSDVSESYQYLAHINIWHFDVFRLSLIGFVLSSSSVQSLPLPYSFRADF